MSDLIAKEGTILFPIPNISKPCETYYKTIGDLSDTSRTPLVIVHGGPGTGHAYLLPLVDLAQLYDIPLLFYDQIGCGRSTHLSETAGDITLWTEALYLRELENVLSYFGLPERGYDYFGQSWGGMMGARFAASRPKGLRRLILANAGMCMELRTKGVSTLVQELPKEIQQAIAEGQRTGDYESPEYQKATDLYFRRHLCRVEPWPCKEVLDAIKNLSDDTTAHDIMHGKSGFTITGTLKGWTVVDVLKNIEVPTLLYNGEHDSVQDIGVAPAFWEIPKVKWVTLQDASHFCHVEQREKVIKLIADFLVGREL